MIESATLHALLKSKRTVIAKRIAEAIAIVVAIAIMFTLINGGYSTPAQVRIERPYDGVTIYRGLFFGNGPVVSKLPTLRKVAGFYPPEYKALETPVINYIKSKDPTYFDKFAADMQSGDRARVADAIKRTNQLQKEALLAVTKNQRSTLAQQVQRLKVNPAPASEPEPENDANVAVEVVVWVALFVAIVIWLVAPQARPTELKGLRFEAYVDEITRAMPKYQRAPVREARP